MTEYAIGFGRKKVAIASDTLAYVPDLREVKPLGFCSKVLAIPHLNAVLFSRGQYEIAVRAWAALMIPLTARTVEEAAAALPEMLRSISVDYCTKQGIDDYRDIGLLELAFVGFSTAKNRMRLWQFGNYQDYATHETPDWIGAAAWPTLSPSYMPAIAGYPSDAQLVQIVKAVGAYFKAEPAVNCGQRIGGEIVVTEITPSGITSRIVHRFADYEVVRNTSAAVVSRYLRGDLSADGVVASGLVSVAEMVDSATGAKLQRAA
jgi:hypothetical protein